jgi:hypothetical protein
MINVVLDTNILHQEGLFSRHMQLLSRLAVAEQVEIHVPLLVKREYISKIDAEAASNLKSMHDKLADFLKKVRRASVIHDDITRAQAVLSDIGTKLRSTFEQDFMEWQDTTKTKIIDFNPAEINSVFDHYFAGSGVFSKPKRREDIPDAFINSCIEGLLSRTGRLDVVIKDGAFSQHLKKLDGVTIYDGLDHYLQAPHILERITMLDAQSERTETVKQFFGSMEFHKHVEGFLVSAHDMVAEISITGSDVEGMEVLGIAEAFDQAVYFIEPHTLTEFQYGGINKIADGHFSIEIFFMADAAIDYSTERSEYAKLPKARRDEIDILERLNGIYDLTEDRFFAFTGHLEVRFDPNFSAEELATHAQYLASGHSKIAIELELDKAQVIAVTVRDPQ